MFISSPTIIHFRRQILASGLGEDIKKVEESRPSNLCTKVSFQSGFIVNVFDNGTVNFQGKPDSNIQSNIETINNV